MESNRLIILARYWNDMDMLAASLEHIEYWDADLVYLSEGAWDQSFDPCSTDGTREYLETYAKDKANTFVIDNVRENSNYRINQAQTSNLVMQLADWQLGDWMMIVDVDQFYTKQDIDVVKETIKAAGDTFDFFIYPVYNFFYNLNEAQVTKDSSQSRLPSKLVKGSRWVKTNHLTLDGVVYEKSINMRSVSLATIKGLHYEGLRPKNRLDLRYSVGNRKSFWAYKDGQRLKSVTTFDGQHSEFAMKVLR